MLFNNNRQIMDKTKKDHRLMAFFVLAGAQGLEPWTPSFGDWCSTD